MAPPHLLLLLLQALLLACCLLTCSAIDCFTCSSIEGSRRDCEDEFGPHNKTRHLIERNCKTGVLKFKAHFCVKIKGVKETGETIVIRTCSMDDWGTQCGDLLFDQGEEKLEPLTGCLASCHYDGCNGSSTLIGRSVTWLLPLITWLVS